MSQQKRWTPPEYETPKTFTARNDVTGAAIQTRGTNQGKYAEGWDLIFNKPKLSETATDLRGEQ
jgi:hypothetical protein